MERVLSIAFDILCLLFVLGCLCYAGYRTFKNSDDPARLAVKWIVSIGLVAVGIFVMRHAPLGYWPMIAALFGMFLAGIWASNLGSYVADPIAGMFDGGRAEPDKKPVYSYAEARRRKGRPKEAVEEARKVLAKFPHDITGALLIAGIQAEDLNDPASAERTIEEYISQPKLPSQAVAAALQNLADLQWRFAKDAAAAMATLQRITASYPDTPLAHAALQRIAHLDTADHTRQQRESVRYTVPTGERNIGLRSGVKPAFHAPEPPDELAALVSQLERHPADVESRERLAVLYAEELGRADLARDQLEQLISLRAETPKRIGHWLNLLATVHARFGNDLASAEEALRRIIALFPKSAMAEHAATRLASLAQEVKAHQASGSIALGSYEKEMGLKKGTGRAPANA